MSGTQLYFLQVFISLPRIVYRKTAVKMGLVEAVDQSVDSDSFSHSALLVPAQALVTLDGFSLWARGAWQYRGFLPPPPRNNSLVALENSRRLAQQPNPRNQAMRLAYAFP